MTETAAIFDFRAEQAKRAPHADLAADVRAFLNSMEELAAALSSLADACTEAADVMAQLGAAVAGAQNGGVAATRRGDPPMKG